MLKAIAMTNFIANIGAKNDNFLINYNRKKQIRKMKRFLLLQNKLQPKRKKQTPVIKNYFDTLKQLDSDVFRSHFGMLHSTFELLKNSLKTFWTRAIRGRLGYSLDKCIYVTLWKLCNSNATFRDLNDRFKIARGTVHKVFYKTVELICLLKSEIMWPSASHQQTIMQDFQKYEHNPFPCVIGCIGGTHLNISAPANVASSYINSKGNYTVIVQAICDSKCRFLDVFIGSPGHCDYAQVWRTSPIFKAIKSNEVPIAENAIIIGDLAYPLSNLLMTPYRDNGHLTCREKQFNHYLNSTRVFVKQSYGMLRQRFKILKYINLGSVEKASKVINACAILHNFIINREQPTEYNIGNTDSDSNLCTEEDELNNLVKLEENDDDMEGVAIRSNLTALFCS